MSEDRLGSAQRAGGSIEILKNRIAEAVFERSFSQRPGTD
jgi:hypothetical protein